jgi:phosphatidylethanolamine/phosphatidyl-N-methylethanolamine N-methyltransferase
MHTQKGTINVGTRGFRPVTLVRTMPFMGERWADYRIFWREFRRTFHTTGAVLPSGRRLSRALARFVRDGELGLGSRHILEVGPGTGAVTRHILAAMRPDDRLALVERNEQFVARLRERLVKEPLFHQAADRVAVHHSGVEELAEDRTYDVIVSGLPLNNFSVEMVNQILAKLQRLLAPSGTLSFFEYIAIRRVKSLVSGRAQRQRLHGIGAALDEVLRSSEIRRDRVLANIPPAYVHHVRWEG